MDQAFVDRINAQIAYERARETPPDGFPKLPDLPLGRYTDPAFYALEQRYLFRRSWLFVGHESEFAGPGSYRTLDAAGLPLVVVRGEDGILRAFFNACRHRGAEVVRDSCGTCRQMTCLYHSWTYDLHGRLVRVPDERDFVGLQRDERGLVDLRCELWGGLVFVNADPEAEPLLAHLGPLAEELIEVMAAPLRLVDRKSVELRCNWKVMAEGFMEVYHARTIHPATVAAQLDPRGAAISLIRNGHARMLTPLRDEVRSCGRADRDALARIEGLCELFDTTNPAYGVFPNFISPLDRRGFPILSFWPVAVDRVRLDITWLGVPWEGERSEVWDRRLAAFDVLMDEDYRNLEPIQRCIEAAAHGGVPLNYQERRIWHLHTTIDAVIGRDKVPAELAVPDLLADWVDA